MFCTINSQLSTSQSQVQTKHCQHKSIDPSFLPPYQVTINHKNEPNLRSNTRKCVRTSMQKRQLFMNTSKTKKNKKIKKQRGHRSNYRETRRRLSQTSGGEVEHGGSSRNKPGRLKVATLARRLRFSFVVFFSFFQLRLRDGGLTFFYIYVYILCIYKENVEKWIELWSQIVNI